MANALKIGDTVYVPCSALPELLEHDTALYKTKVVSLVKKSITIKLPDGTESAKIGSTAMSACS